MNIHAAIAVPLDFAQIEKGVSARKVQALVREGALLLEDVYGAIPERTFKRRLAEKEPLRLDEADAIGRFLRVGAIAEWALGDRKSARLFLDSPNPVLGNRIPRKMARTDAGGREVEALLYRFVAGDPA